MRAARGKLLAAALALVATLSSALGSDAPPAVLDSRSAAAAAAAEGDALLECPCGLGDAPWPSADDAAPIGPALWMHTPKTGSSFIYTLLRAACPGLDMPWLLSNTRLKKNETLRWPLPDGKRVGGGAIDKVAAARVASDPASRCAPWVSRMYLGHHEPRAPAALEARGVDLLGIFREPGARLRSLYARKDFFKLARAQKGQPYKLEGCPGCPRSLFESVDPQDIGSFLEVPGVAGCVARTLTGKYCGEDKVPPTRARADAAAARVRAMRWVGLTERWDHSICLFHRVFGLPQPLRSQGVNIRPTDYAQQQAAGQGNEGGRRRLAAGDAATAVPEWFHDSMDDAVYAAATERFAELLRQYGGSEECAADAQRYAADARARADASAASWTTDGSPTSAARWERFLAPLYNASYDVDGGAP